MKIDTFVSQRHSKVQVSARQGWSGPRRRFRLTITKGSPEGILPLRGRFLVIIGLPDTHQRGQLEQWRDHATRLAQVGQLAVFLRHSASTAGGNDSR
jgi:hypothetical protein